MRFSVFMTIRGNKRMKKSMKLRTIISKKNHPLVYFENNHVISRGTSFLYVLENKPLTSSGTPESQLIY